MRNLLTAIAAVAIIGVAGAVYFLNRDVPSSGTNAPAPAPIANTATNSSPDANAQPASPSASTQNAAGPETTTSSPSTTASTTAGGSAEPTSPSAAPQTAVVPPPSDIATDEHVLGKADAPVTVIEYASMTCPHCARFHEETMPRIKSEFIDKGLVRFVFRPFPLDGVALRASALAQCAPADAYFSILDILFRTQKEWAYTADPLTALKQTARTLGMSEETINRCLDDQAVLDHVIASRKEGESRYAVDSTPSFIINGKLYHNIPFDDYQDEGTTKPGFGKVIKDLLPKS